MRLAVRRGHGLASRSEKYQPGAVGHKRPAEESPGRRVRGEEAERAAGAAANKWAKERPDARRNESVVQIVAKGELGETGGAYKLGEARSSAAKPVNYQRNSGEALGAAGREQTAQGNSRNPLATAPDG